MNKSRMKKCLLISMACGASLLIGIGLFLVGSEQSAMIVAGSELIMLPVVIIGIVVLCEIERDIEALELRERRSKHIK